MKRAILLVDHGSRRPEAGQVLATLAEALRRRVTDRAIHVAHLDVAAPDIAQGIADCVADGADEITLLPHFLVPGQHTREDIPRLVEEARARHPGLVVRVAEPLGTHAGLVEVLLDRIAEAEQG